MPDQNAKTIRESVAKFYEKHGAAFARTRQFTWAEEKLITKRIQSGMTVVDVGAGNGRFAKRLPLIRGTEGVSDGIRKHLPLPLLKEAGCSYIGIEPSATLRNTADKNLDMREGALPRLKLDDKIADVTVCLAVFHHLGSEEERKASVEELIRITKKGGLIAASAWWVATARCPTSPIAQTPPLTPPQRGVGSEIILPLSEGEQEGVLSPPVVGSEGCDLWIPWRAEGADAKRFVHAFAEEEWKKLWTRMELEIEKIGLFGKDDWTEDPKEARNLFVMAKRK